MEQGHGNDTLILITLGEAKGFEGDAALKNGDSESIADQDGSPDSDLNL